MRRKIVLLLTLLFCTNCIFADTNSPVINQPQVQNSVTIPQNVNYSNCTKMFAINNEKLFYLTLGAVTANKFTIEEIQTTNGYIIFKAAGKRYLATIAEIDKTNSILKITPCNNIYVFQPGIILNMFKYIEINQNTEVK